MAKYKKRLKVNWAAIAALVIVCVLVAGICCAGFASRDDSGAWFHNWNLSTWHWSDASEEEPPKRDKGLIALTSDGEKMYAGRSYALPASMTLLNPQAKTADSTYAEGEFVIQARLSNPFIKGSYDWSVEFLDTKIVCPDGSTNSWTTDKTASEFVTVTALEDDSTSAKLKFIAPFGKQIKLSAQLKGTEKIGECVIDCLASDITVSNTPVWTDISDFSDENVSGVAYQVGLGTVFCDYKLQYVQVTLGSEFITRFENYLAFDIETLVGVDGLYEDKQLVFDKESEMWVENSSDLAFYLNVSYADIFTGFEDYSEAHKQAIYYAWYHAAHDMDATDNGRIDGTIQVGILAYYQGQQILSHSPGDFNSKTLWLSGEAMGKDISPDVTLNQNVTFG